MSQQASLRSQVSHCRFPENCVSKLNTEEKTQGNRFRNCSKKGRVELCVMKSHIRKQSLRKILCSYYLRIFPFSPWAPMGSQISLCRFHEKRVSQLLPENAAVTLREEFTDHKDVFQKASFMFRTDDISFISVGLSAIQRSPSQVPQKQ